ncbi:MAG: OadG family protein [Candidatus Euphemobacter frigidus]|nr:OadG family protein [Candidatus Euphemobacter frigidus]MDP8276027.1 OadG family protein [Candidatus Euphemobacter frigidus]
MFDKFISPELLGRMPLVEKISASLFLTVLGMVITFIILAVVCWFTILLSRACRKKPKKEDFATLIPIPGPLKEGGREDESLIAAVISAAIAAGRETTGRHLRVTKIKRTIDHIPQWERVGRIEQLLERGER